MDLIAIVKLKCANCADTLSDPVVIPCGHSVCRYHQAASKICCRLCTRDFDVPSSGFIANKQIAELLDVQLPSFQLGAEYDEARNNTNTFEEALGELKGLVNEPECVIFENMSELRNKIDLRRETLKRTIDEDALAAVDRVNSFETECYAAAKTMKTDIDEQITNWESDCERWRKSLAKISSADSLNIVSKEVKRNVEVLKKTCETRRREATLGRRSESETYSADIGASEFPFLK